MKKTLYLLLACSLFIACGKKLQPTEKSTVIGVNNTMPGDSTIYGLACDGCTDSILILLPYTGGDPDTFDIIQAFAKHRLYGRPHVGDKLAVILSNDSTREVSKAINISTLRGYWSYQVVPTLRHSAQSLPPLPDSIRQRIMTPREYGLTLKTGGEAYSRGYYRTTGNEGMSPVVYPQVKRYTHWHLWNGLIILQTDSASHQQPDTASILLLRRDSLVLRFSDHEQAYYRKKE